MSDHEHGDRIFLHGLRTECIIGFIDWERQMPQTVLIDLEFPCDAARAAATDQVADTIDYKRIAKRVLAWAQISEFQLLESFAHRLALLLLEEFPLQWVKVRVSKPGAIRHSRDVGVTVQRHRSALAEPAR
jgi:7,8-dihydroneopterin aldolase/epimerase/oxygenase